MSSALENAGISGDLEGALFAGLDTLSQSQTIQFAKYTKFILPVDGYVFWIRSGTVSHTGAIHYASTRNQREEGVYGLNRIIFTSETIITEFNETNSQVMYVGTFQGMRFAFAERREFFEQAGLHHYLGTSVLPALATQLIDDFAAFDNSSVIVSNSMPIWLSLNGYKMPAYYPWADFPTIYPSFLSPENLQPPFIIAHVVPNSTSALQSAPMYDKHYSHYQLVSETVRFTLYGMRNQQALDFQDFLFQYSLDNEVFGVMGNPVMQDEKQEQVEIAALAQRKTFAMEVNYYQARTNDIARQLILSASATYSFSQDLPS